MREKTQTKVIPTGDARAFDQALHVLHQGGLVAFPTDTVYGVGALVFLSQAVEGIYRAKGRPRSKPIPILIDRAARLPDLSANVGPDAWLLAERFWPGPLTMILLRGPKVPDVVTAGGPSVALRVPDHEFALRLIDAAGGSLATTSANLSGHRDPVTAQEVLGHLEGRIHLILDGGPCSGGQASTVIDLTGESPTVLRPGPISPELLEQELARLP